MTRSRCPVTRLGRQDPTKKKEIATAYKSIASPQASAYDTDRGQGQGQGLKPCNAKLANLVVNQGNNFVEDPFLSTMLSTSALHQGLTFQQEDLSDRNRGRPEPNLLRQWLVGP